MTALEEVPFKVFMSYRRAQAAGYVGWLCECLKHEPIHRQIFRDVETLKPGDRWREVIEEEVRTSDAILCIIDRDWAKEIARRESAGEDDLVRAEVAAALESQVRDRREVIPVGVGGAGPPSASDLPPEVRPITEQNFVALADQTWHEDLRRLTSKFEELHRRKVMLWPPPRKILTGTEIAQRSWDLLNPPVQMGRQGGWAGAIQQDLVTDEWRSHKYEVNYEHIGSRPNWFYVSLFVGALQAKGAFPPQ